MLLLTRREGENIMIGDAIQFQVLSVAACNRNGLDLQSTPFPTRINCGYPAPQTEIQCQ
ncbi:hypothetical protein ALP12_200396 [Pseudomonas savastanoi pv. phaseolicola]|nr:hypothetical protein ALP12_200396 [Pseudomonas savastanoi pv. phaseolicola]